MFYIFSNILLSFPAIYYVFILDVNFLEFFVAGPMNISKPINQISIITSIIFFYSIPYLLPNIKQNFHINTFKIENFIISVIFFTLLIYYFDFQMKYGGGIFYRLSVLIFENNYLFYIFSIISLNVFVLIFIWMLQIYF